MKKIFYKLLIVGLMLTMTCGLVSCVTNRYTVTYRSSTGGTVLGETEQILSSGEYGKSVIAVADEGYHFVKWSDGNESPERQEFNVTEDRIITAEFERIVPHVLYIAIEGGTIVGEGSQTIPYGGGTQSVTAEAEEGYRFIGWSDGVEDATRFEQNVKEDLVLTAKFERLRYEITYLTSDGGKIVGKSDQIVPHGESGGQVRAKAEPGYRFVKWSDGNLSETRMEEDVKQSLTFTAEFEFLFEGGNGTEEDPLQIGNYEQLQNMVYHNTSSYRLINDLNLSGINHEPIFTDQTFFGRFDGGGNEITGLTIETEMNYASLFGIVGEMAVIENLSLKEIHITLANYNTNANRSMYYVGSVAGILAGTLRSVTVSGEITGTSLTYDGVTVGGIAGTAQGTLENCTVEIAMQLTGVKRENSTGMRNPICIGGLVGVGDAVRLTGCNFNGNVQIMDSTGSMMIGGMVGYYITSNKDCAENLTVENCQVQIQVVGEEARGTTVGGLIGDTTILKDKVLTMNDIAVQGEITGVVNVAGLLYKKLEGYGRFENCHIDVNITAISQAYGLFNRVVEASLINCSSNGDLKAIYVAGFGYAVQKSSLYRCYVTGEMTGTNVFGFSQQLDLSEMRECYSKGKMYAKFRGTLIMLINKSVVNDCYSISDIQVTNTNENETNRTLVAGFSFQIKDSEVTNCYYAGTIKGYVYSAGAFGIGSSVSAFSVIIETSQITNCHVLYEDQSYVMNVVEQNRNHPDSGKTIDLWYYEDHRGMLDLADTLNTGETLIWRDAENGYPKFIWEV